MRNLYLLLFSLLLPFCVSATHIIGGTIMYKYLGNDSFEISVRLYRDCDTGNASFPASLSITVKDTAGTTAGTYPVQLDSILPVPSYLGACVVNPGICVEEGFYTSVRYLPPVSGGRFIYYQYCCRTSYLNNVVNPLSTGTSIFAYIPEHASVNNSSPVWNLRPPLFECQNYPMNYDYGATDPDGDSLVFTYYTPFNDPAPTYPSDTINFAPISWVGGFGANNPCGGPNLTMNPQTGYISGIPNSLGWYASGVRCEEYRNGIKIGEIRRDYPFVIVTCVPSPLSAFFAPAVSCYHDVVQFQNNSQGAVNYHWDFGDPNTSIDTSNLVNPSWTYANAGTYTVTLVANPNSACADTSTMTITVQQVHAYFILNDTIYSLISYQPLDSSWTSDGGAIGWWDWYFGDATSHVNMQYPTHTYSSVGSYIITLIVYSASGCADTLHFPVYVENLNGISESDDIKFTASPNPSDGTFILHLPVKNGEVRVVDLFGRELFRKNTEHESSCTITLDVAPGTYFITYTCAGGTIIRKIVVQ